MPNPYLVDLINVTVPLKRRGRRYIGLCPFHSEKTPSFHVYDNKRKWVYHCFGCGAHGDAIEWLMRQENLTFLEAKKRVGLPATSYAERSAAAKALRLRLRGEIALGKYRDTHPDCGLPDDAIDMNYIVVSAREIDWAVAAYRKRLSADDPEWTDEQLLNLATIAWREQAIAIRANHPQRSRFADWMAPYDCPFYGWASGAFVKAKP